MDLDYFENKFYRAIVLDCPDAKELLSLDEEYLYDAIELEFYSLVSKYGIKNKTPDQELKLIYNKLYSTIDTNQIIYEIQYLQKEIEKVKNQIQELNEEEQKILKEFKDVYPSLKGNTAQSDALRAGIARCDLEYKEKYLYKKLSPVASKMVQSEYVYLFN